MLVLVLVLVLVPLDLVAAAAAAGRCVRLSSRAAASCLGERAPRLLPSCRAGSNRLTMIIP